MIEYIAQEVANGNDTVHHLFEEALKVVDDDKVMDILRETYNNLETTELDELLMHVVMCQQHNSGEELQTFLKWLRKKLEDVKAEKKTLKEFAEVFYRNYEKINTKHQKVFKEGKLCDSIEFTQIIKRIYYLLTSLEA